MAQDFAGLFVNCTYVARTYLYPLRSHVVIFRDEQFSRFSTVMMFIKGTVSRDFCVLPAWATFEQTNTVSQNFFVFDTWLHSSQFAYNEKTFSWLKGQCHEISTPHFSAQSILPRSLTRAKKVYQNLSFLQRRLVAN